MAFLFVLQLADSGLAGLGGAVKLLLLLLTVPRRPLRSLRPSGSRSTLVWTEFLLVRFPRPFGSLESKSETGESHPLGLWTEIKVS